MTSLLAFWSDVLRPLFDALEPRVVVEIGSEHGKTLARVLEWVRVRASEPASPQPTVVHSVDPAPRYDVAAWQAAHPSLRVHRQPSLEVLAEVGPADVVLVDGDHNYYTVRRELALIEQIHREAPGAPPPPAVFLHDVGWPYARRDLYYEPTRIPEAHRHPWARGGVHPTEKELVPHGMNAHLCHARIEGGPANGVLTAVEDHLAESTVAYRTARVPAAFGLAILVPVARAPEGTDAARRIATWATPEVERFIERLEMARIAMLTGARG
ncbi:MAG: class I SAM-dependent methyltransferase [Myxococcota bacterium]